ncbi:hypothetical protein HYZ64_01425 [Candidatus Berkelbacteria bacterium]|nr:hypothetical protein [Candidatus Berkelbacteria bacterium]
MNKEDLGQIRILIREEVRPIIREEVRPIIREEVRPIVKEEIQAEIGHLNQKVDRNQEILIAKIESVSKTDREDTDAMASQIVNHENRILKLEKTRV